MPVTYKPVSWRDVIELSDNIRSADKREINATVKWPIEKAITHSVSISSRSASVFIDDELVCIMGVGPKSILGGVGCPWLIGTNALTKHKRALISESKRLLPEVMGEFSKLENHVHSENKQAIRYLKHLGFTIHDPEPYGCNGELFHKFELNADIGI
jgi:hypothetical protein